MVDTKKEQERDELHRAIWAIADELRGAVDGWGFKNYVLGTMFYRYISENLVSYINQGESDAGDTDFDYANMSDADAEVAREDLVQLATTSSTGGLISALQRAIVTARPKGRCRKHYYWSAIKRYFLNLLSETLLPAP